MSNVIGPIDRPGWVTLVHLKRSLKFMSKDFHKYQRAIVKEKDLFNYMLGKYCKAA